jgi:hypothetical protein
MFDFNIFRKIYSGENDETEVKLDDILDSEIINAALTPTEIGHLFVRSQNLRNSQSFESFLTAANVSEDGLSENFAITHEQINCWKTNGIDEFAKEMLAFAIISEELSAMRYHTCQYCGSDYFTSDMNMDMCDRCHRKLLDHIWQRWIERG